MSVFAICILSSSEVQLLQDNGDVRGRPALQIAVAAISVEARSSKSWKTALVLVVHWNILVLLHLHNLTAQKGGKRAISKGQNPLPPPKMGRERGKWESNIHILVC